MVKVIRVGRMMMIPNRILYLRPKLETTGVKNGKTLAHRICRHTLSISIFSRSSARLISRRLPLSAATRPFPAHGVLVPVRHRTELWFTLSLPRGQVPVLVTKNHSF